MTNSNPSIYLDSHATTPVDPRVVDAMLPYFTKTFGNPSSIDHVFGHEASEAVQRARQDIASVIGTESSDIIFTSGATESDNLALVGVMAKSGKKHMVTCATEHSAILDAASRLEENGFSVTYLSVDEYGMVSPESVDAAITADTALVSIMMANNEVGTIPDIAEIGRITREKEVLFHTDAAQAIGHMPIDVDRMNIDLMSFSSHKIYGPKGIGSLYVRGIKPRVQIKPLISGGGQEKGLRSGTLNVPGIVGFAEAVKIAHMEIEAENTKFKKWTAMMLDKLAGRGAKLNGHPVNRLAHNLNVRFDGVDGKAIINSISKKIAISAGSACTTQTVEPSHVLLALGLSEQEAHTAIRIGCSRFNTDDEIAVAIEEICSCVDRLRKIRAGEHHE